MENGVSSPVTDMETLVRYPATQSAAQLTGCRNFLPAHRCEGGVRLDGWDILLPLHAVGERATVAVPDGAITVEGGTHTARVSRVIRDLNATAVVLRAAEAPDAPPLRVVLPEGVRAAEGDTLSFSLLADRCQLWEELLPRQYEKAAAALQSNNTGKSRCIAAALVFSFHRVPTASMLRRRSTLQQLLDLLDHGL